MSSFCRHFRCQKPLPLTRSSRPTLQLIKFSSHAASNSSAEEEPNEDVSGVSKQHKDKEGQAEMKKQLQQKEQELVAAKGQISRLASREKDLLQRQELGAARQYDCLLQFDHWYREFVPCYLVESGIKRSVARSRLSGGGEKEK